MNKPLFTWKNTFGKLGYKVSRRWNREQTFDIDEHFHRPLHAGELEPRIMLDVDFGLTDYTFSVYQDAQYQTIAGTVDASNGGGGSITYSTTNDPWPFSVDLLTGDISLIAPELIQQGESYNFTVEADDGTDVDLATVQVNIAAEYNLDPTFGSSSYTFDVEVDATAGTSIGSVDATDPEGNGLRYWTEWAWPFSVDPISGDVTIWYTEDFSIGDTISFDVWVADFQGAHSVPVTVNVVDNGSGGGGGGGGGTGGGTGPLFFVVGGPSDPGISGDDETLEGGVYQLNLQSNGTTVEEWLIDWGDNSTPEPVPGSTSVVYHLYPDGDETFEITVIATVDNGGGGTLEGKTPGFWKASKKAPYWLDTSYRPGDNYESIFGVTGTHDPPELMDALRAKNKDAGNNGPLAAMWRHSVAALLNSSHPNINYLYTTTQVITMVQDAYANGTYETTKDLFQTQNELGGDETVRAVADSRNLRSTRHSMF